MAIKLRTTKFFSLSLFLLMLVSSTSVGAHPEIKYDFKFGSFGNTNGLFDHPVDVEVYGNSLFVSDRGNNRIQKFDLQGNFITSFGGLGSGETQLNYPGQIAVNATHVMVADYNNVRIQLYDHDGNHLGSFTDPSLQAPYGIATDGKHIYVSDYYGLDVKMFDMKGNLVKTFGINMPVYPLFVDITDDYVYLAGSYYSSGVDIFDLTGNWIANMSAYTYSSTNDYSIDQTGAAYGIHVTNSRIYISDNYLDKIVIFDRNHKFEYEIGNTDNLDFSFNEPSGMGASDTHLYIADKLNNRIQAFSIIPETTTVTTTTTVKTTSTTTETSTKTQIQTVTADGGSLPSSLPFDFQYFILSLFLLVPISRLYRKRKN